MSVTKTESIPPKLLLVGPAFVTLVVFTQGVTDPVNVTKFFFLGGLAFSLCLSAISKKSLEALWKFHKLPVMLVGAFALASLNALIQSNAPLSQSIYGVYGRNNGFLLYVFLLFCFISVLTISSTAAFQNIIKSLVLAGAINIIYCLWVIFFGDFVGWNNPYGNILGTFGNPNFIGAFLGMFSSVLMTSLLYFRKDKRVSGASLLLLILSVFEILESNAIQGRILFLIGICLNLIFFLWFSRKKLWILGVAVTGTLISGIFGILGALQIGPLGSLVYKDSVSLRGEYWYAGLQMGLHNLFSGVGFDSYGDWYRFFRRSSALVRPGVDTVSNTAHNVYIDLFAFGGAPLFVSYIFLNFAVGLSICRVIKRRGNFDFIFVSLAGAWTCYQLQSIISINQVGLALWGWILGAALIAYERSVSESTESSRNQSKRKQETQIVSPGLRAGLGIVIGLLVAVPPLSADMRWRSSQISRNASQVELSLKSSYMNPNNTYRYLNTVGAFHDSGLDDLAHTYAQKAVKFNSENFELWRMFTYIKLATQEERNKALTEMRRKDPLNTNLEAGRK